MVYFDDVLIPWPQVQHIGNPDHAKWYPQRQFDWIHLETQIRHCVHAELMVGLALLLTQSLGTGSGPVVQAQLAELIRFRETCRAFMAGIRREHGVRAVLYVGTDRKRKGCAV